MGRDPDYRQRSFQERSQEQRGASRLPGLRGVQIHVRL